ncbi:hypothetical protein [Microbacterium sp. TWP3-1-2b2]|uniref:hypothetical protein n=1 Tax=Microbacterium sp. TWP3-1-2b2 TaxID=2804651 RepID=UPI003CE812C6
MLTILATTGRVLLRHWPSLLAWFAAGTLGHYLAIQLAGYVGAWSSTWGFVLLPLAILSKLISFVAMFLVVRDGLHNLQAIAPLSENAAERRKTFLETLLVSILPFFAIYAAWGFLQDDVTDYATQALEVRTGVAWTQLAEQIESGDTATNANALPADAVLQLGFNVASVSVIVVAFAGRWAWKRYGARLPKVLSLLAVYLEAVWVCFSLFLISDGIAAVTSWVDGRAAMVWIDDIREWVGSQLTPVAWIWDGVEWLLGEAGGILLQPLAWLAISGVIYGQAIVAENVRLRHRFFKRTRQRVESLPGPVSRWLSEFGEQFIGRFRPLGKAIVLMWRAGPVMIATYVFLYTVVIAADALLSLAITRVLGPNDLESFWQVADSLIFLLVPLILEPIRFVLVAASYDATLGALRAQVAEEAQEPQASDTPQVAATQGTESANVERVAAEVVDPSPAPTTQGSIEN